MKKNIKGLIMSMDKDCAIVLTPDGQFLKTKVKSGSCFIGDEIAIEINERHWTWPTLEGLLPAFRKPVLQVALSLALVMVGGIGSWAYPTGHIYVDVNPSLGMSYNIYHRVIAMESFNEDGAKVKDKVSFYGKKVSDNVEETLKVMNSEGFIKSEAEGVSGVLIGYTDSKLEKEVLGSVLETSEKIKKTVQVASLKVAAEAKAVAQEQKGETDGLSPIQAELVTRKLNKENPEKKNEKQSRAELKAEIKAAAKDLKEKTTTEIIEENQGEVKVVPNAKADEIKKKNQLKKNDIKEQRKEKLEPKAELKGEVKTEPKAKVKKEPRNELKDTDEKIENKENKENQGSEERIRLRRINEEIAKLNILMEEIQASEAKANQKAAKIKKLMKQIERLEAEKEKLEDD